jgi:hypothetical protein
LFRLELVRHSKLPKWAFFFSLFRDHCVVFATGSTFGVGTSRIGNYSHDFSTAGVRLRTTSRLTAPSLAWPPSTTRVPTGGGQNAIATVEVQHHSTEVTAR